jgi:hypothetical protein
MELKSFVTQALVEIVEAVKDAQEQTKDTDAIINPRVYIILRIRQIKLSLKPRMARSVLDK